LIKFGFDCAFAADEKPTRITRHKHATKALDAFLSLGEADMVTIQDLIDYNNKLLLKYETWQKRLDHTAHKGALDHVVTNLKKSNEILRTALN
jgi:hypothetical protein